MRKIEQTQKKRLAKGEKAPIKDYIIAELFHRFRYAKRLLQIDHPTCGCGAASIGCRVVLINAKHDAVTGLCETHWATITDASDSLWRVRWDEMENAKDLTSVVLESIVQKNEET